MTEIIQLADYSIYVGDSRLAIREYVNNGNFSNIIALVDSNTQKACLPILQEYLSGFDLNIISIPAGELNKNIDTCQEIWQQMMDLKTDRNSLMINLGGGVIGDMGGFCAGTFKRGIQFIQVPTTLLSQVDASIGGKLGIDFAEIKNSIGLFRNPGAVFIDPIFLKTLPKREIRSGFAEVIKHSLINDTAQWIQLRQIDTLEQVNWTKIIAPSLKIKQRIVETDPFEKGIRKALNFGHTIGHAVESYFLKSEHPLLHGEAIAIGMVCESFISEKLIGLSPDSTQQITAIINRIFGKTTIPSNTYPTLIDLMYNDKKNEGKGINFSCISPIGEVHINQEATPVLIQEALDYYNSH